MGEVTRETTQKLLQNLKRAGHENINKISSIFVKLVKKKNQFVS